ncbi:glycoside hydrolase family 16 protein [Nocardioides limicola]|uniref:glycoside hydrolase family 16 protein n=1 Tax=Nocardioides limicola TaxID=2803368 RepID=UPI00193C3E05|nr:glycoside hydrolase family 16 protein [Nocardioides sp. DJM-14]
MAPRVRTILSVATTTTLLAAVAAGTSAPAIAQPTSQPVVVHAPAPTGTCFDWFPNLIRQLQCHLGLIDVPPGQTPNPLPDPWPAPDPSPDPDPSRFDCGDTILKRDGTAWACTFADDFSGTELDRTLWVPQRQHSNGTASVFACYIDDPAVVDVSGGSLNLSVVEMDEPVPCPDGRQTRYAAGQVSTYQIWSQAYGRFEARMRVQEFDRPGLHEAFWLWPDTRHFPWTHLWPASGEIDVMETYSKDPHLAVPFLHSGVSAVLGPVPGLNTAWDCVAHRGEWNTYVLEWSATRIKILVNGRTCLNTATDAAFHKPFLIAFTQALGVGANGYDDSAGFTPATMNVDYVKAWK